MKSKILLIGCYIFFIQISFGQINLQNIQPKKSGNSTKKDTTPVKKSNVPIKQTNIAVKDDTLPLPQEYAKSKYRELYYVSHLSSKDVIIYGNSKGEIITNAKDSIIKDIYMPLKNKYCVTTYNTILDHKDDLVSIYTDDWYFDETKGKEAKFGKYKYYLDSALVNKKLLIYVCEQIDLLQRENMVVVYNPNNVTKVSKQYFEYARKHFETKLNMAKNKILSIQKFDAMPYCKLPSSNDTVNYLYELLECVKKQTVTPAITQAIASVEGVEIDTSMESKNPSLYKANITLTTSLFNANTLTLIQSNYDRVNGYSPNSYKEAIGLAIDKILEKNIDKYIEEITDHYYFYITNGHEFYFKLPDSLYSKNEKSIEANFVKESSIYYQVSNQEDTDDNFHIIKGTAWVGSQNELREKIKERLPEPISHLLKAKGYTFYLNANK